MSSGVPQGKKLRPGFLSSGLSPLDALLWNCVDDPTVSDVVPKEQTSNVPEIVDCLEN